MTSDIDDLVRQVQLPDDYEQASEALIELVSLDPDTGARVALKVLQDGIGDVFLRGFAFDLLYRAHQAAAVDLIEQSARTCEPHVFAEMLTEVAADEALAAESDEVRRAVSALRSALKARTPGDLEEISGSVDMFFEAYGR
ncbi:hypothetical protein KGQ20_14575 [Catenulispora sp. NF23]|uniref:HEAT repeat domain-containing protein n=1 Tax=Catenulispora pinistramenti TaxID=2705254 RepID=A0ABS5KU16_9ACTN|nr:hypothetical protein [Catenulispora pinistramenti]MBS2533997.1 hypothetical protein [Catenulispora pinistramenti]MBS2549548.1 hypothetical protein [Catenulispora pinistramenti]